MMMTMMMMVMRTMMMIWRVRRGSRCSWRENKLIRMIIHLVMIEVKDEMEKQ